MLIEEKSLQHWIDHFYGYGSWQAPFWFVGYEEGGGDLPEEVADRLRYFDQVHGSSKAATLCDIRELYKNVAARTRGPRAELFNNLHDYRFGKHAVQHTIWNNLTAFIHGYQDKKLPESLNYQRNSFGQPSGKEAWIQLYPLPSPHNHAWYYSWLDLPRLQFLKDRELYQQSIFGYRAQRIFQNLATFQPKIVLLYGMNNIAMLKESVQEHFPQVKFKSMKAVPRVIPQHHYAAVKGTQLLITTQIPALRHNRIESGFDWQAFGKKVKEYDTH